MSAVTAAHLRRLRAAVLAPGLTGEQLRDAALAYCAAAEKAPRLVLWWSCVLDGWQTLRRRGAA